MMDCRGPELKVDDVVARGRLLGVWIAEAGRPPTAAHEVELQLFRSVMEWGWRC